MDDRRSQAPPPPRELFADRVAVVVDGNAKQVTDDLVDILDQIVQSGDLFVSRSLAEATEIARMQRMLADLLFGSPSP